MFLYPLLLGTLSLLSPFLGLILLLIFCVKTISTSLVSPLKALSLFFVLPVGLLLWDNSPSSQIMALDAIFAVGGVTVLYLYALKRNHVLSEAFMFANLLLAAYGLLRFQLFGLYHAQAFDQGMELLRTQMPALVDNAMLSSSLPVWKMLLPTVWIFGQSTALLIGYLLFQKMLKVPFTLANLRFPVAYNYLIIAILPLYLFEQTKMLFVNALLALCIIPFLQGISLMWQRLGLIFANRFVLGIFMVIIILYASIFLALFGFADMWLNKRNTIPGGTTA